MIAALTVCVLHGMRGPAQAAPRDGVSPQSISLPSGPGSIEGLGESFEPRLNTGTASYAIPLRVPPGRAGMAPSLSLVYDGGAPNGMLGIGWSLGGLARIQRQTDKGLPRYDETAGFPGTDTFLDGSGEELVPLADRTYRAENEGGFARYVFDRAGDRWTCQLPDGSVLELGASASARVSDGSRTAAWLVSSIEDRNGNRVEVVYTSFPDSPGQVYPSRIFYTRHATETLTGEHVVAFSYEAATRPDPVRDFRSGFQVTTARRLSRVDLCTTGGSFPAASTCDDVGVAGAARVRAYRLDYDEIGSCADSVCARGLVGAACSVDADCVAGATRLAQVTFIGDDGSSELPSTRFSYTELDALASGGWSLVAGFPGFLLGGADAALADVDADGLADIVESPPAQPGLLYRYRNNGVGPDGAVDFGAATPFQGPVERLSTPGTQLLDLDGDGRVDLLSRPDTVTPVFALRRGRGDGSFELDAEPFLISGLDEFSAQGFEDPQVGLADVDFDKRIDVVRVLPGTAGSAELRVRYATTVAGQDQLGPQQSCAGIPGADLATPRTALADLNGDRLLDVVVVTSSALGVDQIVYYPARGRGGFGIGGTCGALGVPVAVGGDPVTALPGADFAAFDQFSWTDLTGDGLADLLHVGPFSATAWINRGGTSLRRLELGGHPAGTDFDRCPPAGCDPLLFDRVERVDLNGNGTSDLVFIDRETGTTWLLDVVALDGVPPNLLRTIDNGLGLVTTIDYEPSTVDYLESLEPGATPWLHVPPFPVTLVSARRMRFGLDLDGVPGEDEYLTEYRYRDGYYDGVEKEFRGFAEVEKIERGDVHQPTLVTRHRFHTGAPDGVDNDGDGLVDERSARGGAEEESLKGVLLEQRTETCSDGPEGACSPAGDVFAHDLSRWEVRTLHGATGTVCSGDASVGCCADADCSGPGLGGSCVAGGVAEPGLFATNEACVAGKSVRWAVTTAQRSSVIELGQGPRVDLMTELDWDGFGNATLRRDWGIVDAAAPPPFGCQLATGTCSLDATRICALDDTCADSGAGTCEKRSAADGTACPAADPFAFTNAASPVDERAEQMSWAINEGDWLLRCEQETTIADAAGTIESRTRSFWDDLPLGQCLRGNRTGHEAELIQESRFIPRERVTHDVFGNPVEILDARDNRRTLDHDAAFETFVTGETVHLDGYQLSMSAAYHEGFGVVERYTTWAETGEGPEYRVRHDAFARPVALVSPGDSDAAPTLAYAYRLNVLGDGISSVDIRRREEAGGGTIDAFRHHDGLGRQLASVAEDDAPGSWVVSGAMAFGRRGSARVQWLPYAASMPAWAAPDPLGDRTGIEHDAPGRVTRRVHPDLTFSDVRYAPLSTDHHDENDTAGLTPGAHTTRAIDGLGRLERVVERIDGRDLVTEYHHDARDNLLVIEDAHGNRTLATYDALSRLISLDDPDRGRVSLVHDDADNLVSTLDARGQRIEMTYDRANRLLTENYLDSGGPPAGDPVDVRYHYDRPAAGGVPLGDGTTGAATFTAGELSWVADLSGEEHHSYDARRRSAWIAKRIRRPDLGVLDSFTTFFAHDSADRITTLTYPDGDRLVFEYGARGLPDRIGGESGGQVLVSSMSYRASGQPEQAVLGSGVTTAYAYDARTRLTGITTAGAGATSGLDLVRYAYTLDPVSNLSAIEDLRAHVPPADPRHDTQRLRYDDLHRLVSYRLSVPGDPAVTLGGISYAYDDIDNLLSKTSDIELLVDGRSATSPGALGYGGAAGRFGRTGRAPGAPAGPHALTSIDDGTTVRAWSYDANGNVAQMDEVTATWDFKDRLVALEGPSFEAEYLYDHADRRIARSVVALAPHAGLAAGERRVTLYPSDRFEVRDGAQPTKFLLVGGQRIAEITGTLDPLSARVQRIPLRSGWNQIVLAVEAADAGAQLGLDGSGPITAAYLVSPPDGSYAPVAAGAALPAGSILWLLAGADHVATLRGVYSEPSALPVPASGLVGARGLWPLPAATLPGERAWLYDPAVPGWRSRLPAPLAVLSDLPGLLATGRVVQLVPQAGSVDLPPAGARIRYHHGDHLGSATVISDAAGALVEETAFLPFGEPRVRTAGESHGIPASSYLFTGKERDRESGLHDLDARLYAAALGRFLSVDDALRAPRAQPEPRRLNAYAYGLANPLRFVDPDGRNTVPADPTGGGALGQAAAQHLAAGSLLGARRADLHDTRPREYAEVEWFAGTAQAVEDLARRSSVDFVDGELELTEIAGSQESLALVLGNAASEGVSGEIQGKVQDEIGERIIGERMLTRVNAAMTTLEALRTVGTEAKLKNYAQLGWEQRRKRKVDLVIRAMAERGVRATEKPLWYRRCGSIRCGSVSGSVAFLNEMRGRYYRALPKLHDWAGARVQRNALGRGLREARAP